MTKITCYFIVAFPLLVMYPEMKVLTNSPYFPAVLTKLDPFNFQIFRLKKEIC